SSLSYFAKAASNRSHLRSTSAFISTGCQSRASLIDLLIVSPGTMPGYWRSSLVFQEIDLKSRQTTNRQTYPRYSTALFLSRTATDEPGSARQHVALEPSSNSILNAA